MKKMILLALLLTASTAANAQFLKGYNDAIRDQQRFDMEMALRKAQLERTQNGYAPDPAIQRSLDESDARRAARACYDETIIINGRMTTCTVCPAEHTTTCNN